MYYQQILRHFSLDFVLGYSFPYRLRMYRHAAVNERVAAAGKHIKHRIATPCCLSLSLFLICLISTIDLTAFPLSIRVSATLQFKRLHRLSTAATAAAAARLPPFPWLPLCQHSSASCARPTIGRSSRSLITISTSSTGNLYHNNQISPP